MSDFEQFSSYGNDDTEHCGTTIARTATMEHQRSQSDQLEERLIEFAARIIRLSTELPTSVATSKPAMCGHFKTGHMKRRPGQGFSTPSVCNKARHVLILD
jgi:hypothetical protein